MLSVESQFQLPFKAKTKAAEFEGSPSKLLPSSLKI
jgi:hypothetical protein